MDEVLSTANDLFSSFLGSAVDFKICRTTQNGDIFCPQRISESLRREIAEKGLQVEDILSLEQFQGQGFLKVVISPQGQLCVSLNRPIIFTKCICSVASLCDRYGNTSSHAVRESVSLWSHVTVPESSTASDPSHHGHHASNRELTVAEGRCVLVTGLLVNVLRVSGYSVNCVNYNIPLKDGSERETDPDFHIWHLLSPFITSVSGLTSNLTEDSFLSSLSLVSRTAGVMETNVRPFLQENSLVGKQGFDKNLDRIQVTDERRRLTSVSSVGHKLCALCQVTCEGGHVIINVAEQRKSYSVQQSMVLMELFKKTHHNTSRQHLLLTGGVEVTRNGVTMKQCSLKELNSIRLQQMTQAYVVRYGEEARAGPQLRVLAVKMSEAVVKFELLSLDPSSTVKLDLPDIDHLDADVRFAGAFVLYNYARASAVLSTFNNQGVYPPLPAASSVDFTLLTDEDEWKLLFQYVLQYPMVTREAAQIKTSSVGIHIDISLKKICLFLTELSHLFSSYYSRVKILLPPEPHLLPLVFARVHLVTAIRRVMNNALSLLAIDPPEQL